jgi:hypothetical protein
VLATLLTNNGINSLHDPTGNSATATYATHCAAELGLLFSVPNAPKIYKITNYTIINKNFHVITKYNENKSFYIFLNVFPCFSRDGKPALLVLELHFGILGGKLVFEL